MPVPRCRRHLNFDPWRQRRGQFSRAADTRCHALKVLAAEVSANAECRARFNREADLASELYHPHIVGVHDRGEDDGQL
jgi:serine/threonine protein kinase